MIMQANDWAARLRRKLGAFGGETRGAALIEFALIVPILIGMYFMLNETASGMRAARKTTMVARVMADLTTRKTDITDGDKSNIFASASPIVSPFTSAPQGYRLTSIRFDQNGKGYVHWSEVTGTGIGSAYAKCTPTEGAGAISVPDGLKVANSSVVLAEALLRYKPIIGWNITGEIDLKDKLFMRPRTSDFVTRNGNTAAMGCPGSSFP
jgi:Flp pilus assembly protein TadG